MGNTIYESLGSFFEDNNFVEDEINTKIFNSSKIVIKIVPFSDLDDSLNMGKDNYLITEVTTNNCVDEDLKKAITSLNVRLTKENNFNRNSWKLFYLFKEIITQIEELGYNYFRGQQQNWVTKPAIFRNYIKKDSEDQENYYKNFEYLYQEIVHEFPNEISYIPYPTIQYSEKEIQSRANSLSILQHYGLYTSLLDITENPFVAMLFMFGTDSKISNPQFEAYRVNKETHESRSIVTFVDKIPANKRIKAQNGAFLNYDKLQKFINYQKDNFTLKPEYQVIERIVISIEIDKEHSIFYLKQEREKSKPSEINISINFGKFLEDLTDSNVDNDLKKYNMTDLINLYYDYENDTDKKSDLTNYEKFINDYVVKIEKTSESNKEELENIIKCLEDHSSELIEKTFADIKREIIQKLREFSYYEKNLYPDFIDYLRFKKNEYTSQRSNNTLTFNPDFGDMIKGTS